jgi:hypothetical protein
MLKNFRPRQLLPDFPAPFALAPQARTVSSNVSGAHRQLEVAFYAQSDENR